MLKNNVMSRDDLIDLYADIPSIKLKEMFENTKHVLNQLEEVMRERGRREEPTPECDYSIKQITEDGIDGIRITGTIINRDAKDAHMAIFNSISGDWNDRHSVLYYRVNGLIFHQHGGWLILANQAVTDVFRRYDTPIPCTDEQWEQLLNGTIPVELMNKNI